VAYFCCSWMSRHGETGKDSEFTTGQSFRWNANGGDSAKHYWSAVASINAWRRVLRRANFVCMDAFDFLAKCKDEPKNGIYVDAPWPDDGDDYKHKFTELQQRRLAARLGEFKQARVVVRFGEHPLIRELYPEPLWTWKLATSRTQGNNAKAEALIVNQAT